MGSRETTARTVTTKTKTKTKMPSKNIIVVSGPSLGASRTRRGGTDKNYSLWGGGSTTVVSPDGSNGDVILAELECVPSVVKYNNIEGVAIDTPSNGILSFNTLLEGKTG